MQSNGVSSSGFKLMSDEEIRLAADIGFDDDEFSGDGEDEEQDDVIMPPPNSMFKKGGMKTGGFKSGLNTSLARARSSSPRKGSSDEQPARRGMQRIVSLPNIQYDRSVYNRSVGKNLDSIAGNPEKKGTGDAQRRASEFDKLLDDL
jgi:hypothetical protein